MLLCSTVWSQDIRFKKPPLPKTTADQEATYDKWWVSGALRDDAEPSILGSAYKTEAEAVAHAKRWLDGNHKVNKPSDWTYLKFVEIEADVSVKDKGDMDSKGKGSFFESTVEYGSPEDKLFTAAIDRAGDSIWKDVKNALKKRQEVLTNSFRRAKEGMDFMQSDVKKLEAAQFRKVNGLVKEYNSTRMSYSTAGPGSQLFAKLQPMKPIDDEMIKQAIDAQNKAKALADAEKPKGEEAVTKATFVGEWKGSQVYLILSDDGDAAYNHNYAFKSNGTWSFSNGSIEIKTTRTENYNCEPVYYRFTGTIKDGKLRLSGTESINFPIGRKEFETGAFMERK